MALPQQLLDVLPDDTARTWEVIAPALPRELYLIGGTALAVHIHHRVSQDLDFFFHEEVDLDELAAALQNLGPFAVSVRSEGTLNGLFSETKVQFLNAESQRRLEPPATVAGMRVAGMSDIFATKLKVIGHRGELRDYFDVMEIERKASRRVEEGIGLFMSRYQVRPGNTTINHIVSALGYLGDVDEDHRLPVEKDEIEQYWRKRQPQIVRNLARFSV